VRAAPMMGGDAGAAGALDEVLAVGDHVVWSDPDCHTVWVTSSFRPLGRARGSI
jgi:hypothetical protein